MIRLQAGIEDSGKRREEFFPANDHVAPCAAAMQQVDLPGKDQVHGPCCYGMSGEIDVVGASAFAENKALEVVVAMRPAEIIGHFFFEQLDMDGQIFGGEPVER